MAHGSRWFRSRSTGSCQGAAQAPRRRSDVLTLAPHPHPHGELRSGWLNTIKPLVSTLGPGLSVRCDTPKARTGQLFMGQKHLLLPSPAHLELIFFLKIFGQMNMSLQKIVVRIHCLWSQNARRVCSGVFKQQQARADA